MMRFTNPLSVSLQRCVIQCHWVYLTVTNCGIFLSFVCSFWGLVIVQWCLGSLVSFVSLHLQI